MKKHSVHTVEFTSTANRSVEYERGYGDGKLHSKEQYIDGFWAGIIWAAVVMLIVTMIHAAWEMWT